MSEEDLVYLHNLPEADKMKLFSQASFYTYQATSLFSLVVDDRGNVLAMASPSKVGDTWKGKCEDMKHKCSKIQEKMPALRKNVCCIEMFQEEAGIHGSPSTLVAIIVEFESSIEVEKNHHKETTSTSAKAESQVEETVKSLQEEETSYDEYQNAHDD